MTDCYLIRDENIPTKAAFPVIDAHNHLWGNASAKDIVSVMDEVGVVSFCDLTANTTVAWIDGGYQITPADIADFFTNFAGPCPKRFYGFTMATFAASTTEPLFADAGDFVRKTIDILTQHVQMGARGLKLTKELGLLHRDANGDLINIDDPRLGDIWETAADLGIPVLLHQSDPAGFFHPTTPENEHFSTLDKYPAWSFADAKFPRKEEILQRRDNLVNRHKRTTFILAHMANWPENLAYVSRLLDDNPNVYIDFSARIDELGRQPYTSRELLIKYQDRILFGTDMPATAEMYRCYFRFLETFDEYFFTPDYDGTFGRHRWGICGIGLPADVLAKIYHANAMRIVPGLAEDLNGIV